MGVDSKHLAAVFFITEKGARTSLQDLLATAGASQISPPDAVTRMADCVWADWQCKGYVDSRPTHQVLHILFWQSDFLEKLDEEDKPLEQDGLHHLITAFQSACDVLAPQTALILTHVWQADIDAVRRLEPVVLSKDVNTLIEEDFGALYLDDQVRQFVTTTFADRDVIKTRLGLIIFAGKGEDRWL
jgi:hypothetical protein